MEKRREEKKTYAAPSIEFHAVVQDIIMCSGDTGTGSWPGGGGHSGGTGGPGGPGGPGSGFGNG